MSAVFVKALTASFYGSIVIGAVLLLRLGLRKAPKKYVCLLWLLAFARLLMPFEIESGLSLQPKTVPVNQVQWQELEDNGTILAVGIPMDQTEEAELEATGIPAQVPVQTPSASDSEENVEVTVEYALNWAVAIPWLWLVGICAMGVYTLTSYIRLKRSVREAVRCAGVWECAGLETAFILGFVRPRIYVPVGMTREDRELVLKHERTHLARGDHWFKLAGYLALAVHWFNPLVWAAYILLCRDVEMACDERVVRNMGLAERKKYSAALLSCSANRVHLGACPVAFGEISVKERIRKVLNYKKPGFWICLVCVAAIAVVAVCLMTSPGKLEEGLQWAGALREKDVASIELFLEYDYVDEEKRYQAYEGEELGEIIGFLNRIDGKYSDEQKEFGASATLVVTMRDGTVHRVCKCGAVFLTVDGVLYIGDTDWMDQWPREGNGAIPETASGTEATEPAGLQNPYADYEYRYTGRDREWEEDIVYLAETFLDNHLKLTDKYYFAVHAYEADISSYLVSENDLFDRELREKFIRGIDSVLERIPELEDVQIRYEVQRIVALLEDASGKVLCESQEYFPVMVEALEGEDGMGYYAVRIPNAYADVIYARLTAVNGVPVYEAVDRLRAYVSSENRYFEEANIIGVDWRSLLIRKEALQAAGIVDWDADTAEFRFLLEDGTEKTVTLTAITSEEYDVSDMTRVDFYAKRIHRYANPSQYYWYEARPEDGMVYVNMIYCNESQESFAAFSKRVLEELGSSEEYRKLVLDLRHNTGGSYPMSGIDEFYRELSRLENVDVYVLIDGGTAAAAMTIATRIRDSVPGAVLVGTPAGQTLNVLGDSRKYTTDNKELVFYISAKYWMNSAENAETLMPDLLVYQTLEDYKRDVDSVLAAVLAR